METTVFTHILSVMLHCCGGASVVVVKGEMKIVVAPLGGLVLGTSGVNVLLLVWVLTVEVVVVLLVTGASCGVVVVVDCVVTLREGMVVVGFLVFVYEATVVVESFTEAVVVSCRGVRGDT